MKLKSSLHKDGIISELKFLLTQSSGAYLNWRVSKAVDRSFFSCCTCIYTVTSAYSNPLYDNAAMVSMAKRRGIEGLRTANMPVGKEASTQGSKKPKPKQTHMTKWRSVLSPEPEDQAPKAHTESLLSSLSESNLDHHSQAQSIADTQDLTVFVLSKNFLQPIELKIQMANIFSQLK